MKRICCSPRVSVRGCVLNILLLFNQSLLGEGLVQLSVDIISSMVITS